MTSFRGGSPTARQNRAVVGDRDADSFIGRRDGDGERRLRVDHRVRRKLGHDQLCVRHETILAPFVERLEDELAGGSWPIRRTGERPNCLHYEPVVPTSVQPAEHVGVQEQMSARPG